MGMAVTFVMVLATMVTYLIQVYVLEPLGIAFMQTITFILVIASLVQMVEIILKKIGSKVKLHLAMENSGHCVILDREREIIFERVLHLINTSFKQGESRFE